MAKRFTATEKWEDAWFRKLKPVQKLLWFYMLDRCDIAGVLELDLDLAGFCIGGKVSLDDFEGRIVALNGSKYWIPKFIEFQYGCTVTELNPASHVHASVLKSVERYGLLEKFKSLDTLSVGYIKGSDTPKDKNKDKDKDKSKDITVPSGLDAVVALFAERKYPASEAEKFWNYYQSNGWKVGKNPMKDWKAAAANWMKNAREWKGQRQPDPPPVKRSTYHCPECGQDHPVSQKCEVRPVASVLSQLTERMKR